VVFVRRGWGYPMPDTTGSSRLQRIYLLWIYPVKDVLTLCTSTQDQAMYYAVFSVNTISTKN